jgi:hypothetical protein
VRDELRAQHEGVRNHLEAARRAAQQWALGEAPLSQLRDELERLGGALRSHHLSEERVLGELARSIDERARGYDAILAPEHAGEHRAISDALVRLGWMPDPGESGRELERFCERLLTHMTWEERAFLNAAVVRDDDE